MRKASAVKALVALTQTATKVAMIGHAFMECIVARPIEPGTIHEITRNRTNKALMLRVFSGSSYLPGKSLKIGTPPNSYD
jgi:hypothetical protein